MSVVLFVGSPRVRSNTRSIAAFLRERLESLGADVVTLDPKRAGLDDESFVSRSVDTLRGADTIVILAPVYFDAPPHVALAWLRALWSHREALDRHVPALYGVTHSGYFESIHKRPSLETFEHFGRAMGWPWHGGLAFGGTSPIDGRPLEGMGPFTRRLRPSLDRLARTIHERRAVPSDLVREASKRPIPLPKRWIVWIMNTMIRAARRRKGRGGP